MSERSVRESLAQESIFNLLHHESVIKVDCIIRKSSAYRRVEFERRSQISLLDFTTFIVSKEDLIISKLSWAKDSHSELQLGDVQNLLATEYDAIYCSAGRANQGWITYSRSASKMTDTRPEIERLMREKIIARSGEERFVMGAQMFESACEMVRASLPRGLPEAEQRRQLFKRLYGKELE